MSDTELHLLLFTGMAFLYCPAYCLKKLFSGARFTATGAVIAWAYNACIGAIHVHFLETSVIPFYGYFDNWLMGGVSIIMIYVHACSFPSPSRKAW